MSYAKWGEATKEETNDSGTVTLSLGLEVNVYQQPG
jgi:hypothetical protein